MMHYVDQIEAFHPSCEQEVNDQRMILSYIRQFPQNILTRENEIAHLTSSGLILNPELDKVLLIHHNIYNTWAWTGGHADGDSDLLEIALKEAREETGVQSIRPFSEEMFSLDICPVFGHVKKGRYVCCHQHLNSAYVLLADETATLAVKPDENSGVRWFPVAELDTVVDEPYFLAIYKKILAKVKSRRLN